MNQYKLMFNTTAGFPVLTYEFDSATDKSAEGYAGSLVEQMVGCRWFVSGVLFRRDHDADMDVRVCTLRLSTIVRVS
jgi:hypothetical protein